MMVFVCGVLLVVGYSHHHPTQPQARLCKEKTQRSFFHGLFFHFSNDSFVSFLFFYKQVFGCFFPGFGKAFLRFFRYVLHLFSCFNMCHTFREKIKIVVFFDLFHFSMFLHFVDFLFMIFSNVLFILPFVFVLGKIF